MKWKILYKSFFFIFYFFIVIIEAVELLKQTFYVE